MDKFNAILQWASENPELTALILGTGLEIVTRKIPGTITFLHALSKVLDLIPGLKNNPGDKK